MNYKSDVVKKERYNIDTNLHDINEDHQDPILMFAQRYQAFFESTTDAIAVFNTDGDLLDANPQMLKLSGYPYSSIVSKSLNGLFNIDCCNKIYSRFNYRLNGRKQKNPIACALISRTGSRRPVEMGLSLLKNQYGYSRTIMAVIRDVTWRKEIENRLIQRAEELHKVFDTVPAVLLVLDDRKRIRRINRSGTEVFIKDESLVLGSRIGDAIGCENRHDSPRGCGNGSKCSKCAIRESILRCLKLGETVLNVEDSLYRGNVKNSPFFYRINVVPLETNGKRWSVVSMEDITDRRKAEIETQKLNQSIARANIELKKTLEDLARSQSQLVESQKMEQIGLLASGLAHNLRTPLSGIKGYAQLLKLDYKNVEGLDIIVNEVEAMEYIINNLMLKSRKGHENLEEYLNLNDLLKIELEFLSANMFYKHRVTKKIDLDKNLPAIRGIYGHFSQAIMNIVQNALDAMYESRERVLKIQTRHDDKNLYVEICDTGCGIPEEIQDKVFDIFFTTKPTSVDRKGDEPHGTGLGLSSANFFIQKYEGRIELKSSASKGTKVTIKIPYNQKK
jgi:PAS domain S-box-containing protein